MNVQILLPSLNDDESAGTVNILVTPKTRPGPAWPDKGTTIM